MTPEYYKFPGNTEAIDITRHLTSNGGQSAQYIARSCRLDGNNKHEDSRSDLRKAIHLLIDEYERVGGNPDDLKDLLPTDQRDILLPVGYSTIDVIHIYGDQTQYELNDAFFTLPEQGKLSQEAFEKIRTLLLSGQSQMYLTF